MPPLDDVLSPELLALIDRYHAAQAISLKAIAESREFIRLSKELERARAEESSTHNRSA